MILTTEQYLDENYFSPEIIDIAESFIKDINIIINNIKYSNPKLLEFNIFINPDLLKFKIFINKNDYTYNNAGLKSGIIKYIIIKFKEAGWIISKIDHADFGFNIQHPKFATFK